MMKLGLLGGEGAKQSLSPRLHTLFAEHHQLALDYQIYLGESETMAKAFLQSLKETNFHGLNITAPYKHLAYECYPPAVDTPVHSVNTLVRTGKGFEGHSTDGEGLLAALMALASPKRVLVVGAGGAALSAIWALHEAGIAIYHYNRTPNRALPPVPLVRLASLADCPTVDAFVYAALESENPAQYLALPTRTLISMNYQRKGASPLVRLAREAGWAAEDGLRMLVWQGRRGFALWSGILPSQKETEAIYQTLRKDNPL